MYKMTDDDLFDVIEGFIEYIIEEDFEYDSEAIGPFIEIWREERWEKDKGITRSQFDKDLKNVVDTYTRVSERRKDHIDFVKEFKDFGEKWYRGLEVK